MQVSTKAVPRTPGKQKEFEPRGQKDIEDVPFSSKEIKPNKFAFLRAPGNDDFNYSILGGDNVSEKYKQLSEISEEYQQGLTNFRLPKIVEDRMNLSNIVDRTDLSKAVDRDQLSSVVRFKQSQPKSTSKNFDISPHTQALKANRTLLEEARYRSIANQKGQSNSPSETSPHTQAIRANRALLEEARYSSIANQKLQKGQSNSPSETSPHTQAIKANRALQEEARHSSIANQKGQPNSPSETLDISPHTQAIKANHALQEEARYWSTANQKGQPNSPSETLDIRPHTQAIKANHALQEETRYWSNQEGQSNSPSENLDISPHTQAINTNHALQEETISTGTTNQKLQEGQSNSTSETLDISPHTLPRNTKLVPQEASYWFTGPNNHKLEQKSNTADNVKTIEQNIEGLTSHTAMLDDSNINVIQKMMSPFQPQSTLQEPLALHGAKFSGNTTKPSQTTRKPIYNVNAFKQEFNVQGRVQMVMQGERSESQNNRGVRQRSKWPDKSRQIAASTSDRTSFLLTQKLSRLQDKQKSVKNTQQQNLQEQQLKSKDDMGIGSDLEESLMIEQNTANAATLNFVRSPERMVSHPRSPRQNQVHEPEDTMALYGATLAGNTTTNPLRNTKKSTIIVNPAVRQEFNLKPNRRGPQRRKRVKSKFPEESLIVAANHEVAASTSDHTSSSFTEIQVPEIPNHRSSVTNSNTQRLQEEVPKRQTIVNNTIKMEIEPKESSNNNRIRDSSIDNDHAKRFNYSAQRNSITTPIKKEDSTKRFLAPCIVVRAHQNQETSNIPLSKSSSSSNSGSPASTSGELGPIQASKSSPGELVHVQARDSSLEVLEPIQVGDSSLEVLEPIQVGDSSLEVLEPIQVGDSSLEVLEPIQVGDSSSEGLGSIQAEDTSSDGLGPRHTGNAPVINIVDDSTMPSTPPQVLVRLESMEQVTHDTISDIEEFVMDLIKQLFPTCDPEVKEEHVHSGLEDIREEEVEEKEEEKEEDWLDFEIPKLTPELNEVSPLSFTRAFTFSFYRISGAYIRKRNNESLKPLPVTIKKRIFPKNETKKRARTTF